LLKWPWLCLLFLPLVLLLVIVQPAPRSSIHPPQGIPLAVISAPDDPYYPLAEEIAVAEGAPLVSELKEGLSLSPQVLVWITSPDRLSYRVMVRAGQELLAAGHFSPLSIVTASTLAGARALWERRTHAGVGPMYAVNARYPTASMFEGRILAMDQDPPARRPLTLASLQQTLSEAGYLTHFGHAGGRTWMIDESVDLTAADVPELPASVISSASCETFRPWGQNSLLLSFADKGVAAYSGFTFSPGGANFLGEFDGMPFRYTWSEFPIGMVGRVQVEGSLQVFAAVPFHFTLGDPRIAWNAHPPYRLKNETRTDRVWTLEYQGAPAGVVPVRIEGGEGWHFVDVQGVGNIVDGGRSYHAHLQMANLNGDKYLLFVHEGGDFKLRLERQVPLWWRVLNPMMNALDEAYINSKINDIGSYILAVAILAWVLVLWRRLRKPGFKRALLVGLAPALVITLWRAGYAGLRVGETMINDKPLYFEPVWYLSGLLLSWAGVVLLWMPGSRVAKIVGLVFALMMPLFPGIFWAGMFTVLNLMLLGMRDVGGPVYHLYNALFELTAAAFEFPLFVALMTLTARFLGNPAVDR